MSQQQQQERVSARGRVVQHESTGGRMLRVPEGINFYNVDNTRNRRIEIIPFVAGQGNPFATPGKWHYERTLYVHRSVGPNQEPVLCPAKTANQRCPICEHKAVLAKRGADKDTLKDLSAKERQLFWVFDHDQPDRGVQLWEISFHNFGKTLDAQVRVDTQDPRPMGYEYFADPVSGFTLRTGWTEEPYGGGTFLKCTSITFQPRGPIPPAILAKATCLDDFVVLKSYEEISELYHGAGVQDEAGATMPTGGPDYAPWGGPAPAAAPQTHAGAAGDGWGQQAPAATQAQPAAPAPTQPMAAPTAQPATPTADAWGAGGGDWGAAPGPAAQPAPATQPPPAGGPAAAPAPAGGNPQWGAWN